jgi:predicted RNase H-like HicB family nuclease
MKRRPASRPKAARETRFTVVIEPCDEGGYFAECPALPGCHVEGESIDEVLVEMRAVAAAYIADLRDAGEPTPPDEVTVTSLRVAV